MDLNVGKVARGEAVTAGAAHPAGKLALVERDPRLERRRRELVVELVLELLNPALVALSLMSALLLPRNLDRNGRSTYDVVARHIRITRVNEEANAAFNELGQELRAVARAVALQRERLVHIHVAAREVERGVHAQLTLRLRQVHPRVDPGQLLVAQLAVPLAVALSAHVVHVPASLCMASL